MMRKQILFFLLLMISFPIHAKSNLDMIEASKQGNIEIVKALLKEGADVNIVDDTGRSSLIYAAENGHIEIVTFLLNNGADLNKKSLKGKNQETYQRCFCIPVSHKNASHD